MMGDISPVKIAFRRRCGKLCSKPGIFVLLLIITIITLWTYLQYRGSDEMLFSWSYYRQDDDLRLRDGRLVALQLQELYRQFERSYNSKTPPRFSDLVQLKSLSKKLYPGIEFPVSKTLSDRVLCPEMYLGPSIGWQTVKCEFTKPIGQLVTIVLNEFDVPVLDLKKTILQLIEDFQISYPTVKVMVFTGVLTDKMLSSLKKVNAKQIKLLPVSKDVSPFQSGPSWNAAIQQIDTPFVFLARGILRFSNMSSPLERLLRVLTEVPRVGAVGGSVRNATGHWKVGCFQTQLKNYVLKYKKGYHVSINESMLCDYIDGPFVTSTSLMKSIQLNSVLNSSVLFQDFFLTVSRDWLSALCPDVMFYANAAMADEGEISVKHTWLAFARKWELNRILIEYPLNHILHKFSCSDVGISCQKKIGTTSSYAIPVCCQEEMARALRFWVNFTTHYKLDSYFDSGTGLGAVKMSDMIPWDLDADAGYPEQNYTFIKSQLPLFQKNDLNLGNFEDPVCCDKNPNGLKRSYYKLFVSGMYIEMWGEWSYPYDTFRYKSQEEALMDTKMEVHGVWVNGPPNPGYYARKRYGPGCLKHALSWSQTGKKTSWEPYEAGKFQNCSNPSHHACLDRLSTDGNIAFMVPEW